jgi:hypothetical protein
MMAERSSPRTRGTTTTITNAVIKEEMTRPCVDIVPASRAIAVRNVVSKNQAPP